MANDELPRVPSILPSSTHQQPTISSNQNSNLWTNISKPCPQPPPYRVNSPPLSRFIGWRKRRHSDWRRRCGVSFCLSLGMGMLKRIRRSQICRGGLSMGIWNLEPAEQTKSRLLRGSRTQSYCSYQGMVGSYYSGDDYCICASAAFWSAQYEIKSHVDLLPVLQACLPPLTRRFKPSLTELNHSLLSRSIYTLQPTQGCHPTCKLTLYVPSHSSNHSSPFNRN